MRENCLQQFEAHWNCLELNNQVSPWNLQLGNLVCSHCRIQRNIHPVGNLNAHSTSACSRNWYVNLRRVSVMTLSQRSVTPQGLVKTIPGTSPGQTPIHEVENPLYGRMQK